MTPNEKYKNIISSYYNKVHGIMLVYDISNKQSFKDLYYYLIEIEKSNQNLKKLLIGNKINLNKEREVTYEEGKKFAEYYGMNFIEVCPKTSENINEAFEILVKEILQNENEKKKNNIEIMEKGTKENDKNEKMEENLKFKLRKKIKIKKCVIF